MIKEGDRVSYHNNLNFKGTIINITNYGYIIRWDDSIISDVYISCEQKYNLIFLNKKKGFMFR